MTSTELQPQTIQKLGNAPYAAFAMVAGMQLELFTPLGAGPMRAEELAASEALETFLRGLHPATLAAGDLVTRYDFASHRHGPGTAELDL